MPKRDGTAAQTAEAIRAKRAEISCGVVERIYQRAPQLWEGYGKAGRELCLRDIDYHLTFLIESTAVSDPWLFREYTDWLKGLFSNLHLPKNTVPDMLGDFKQILPEILPPEVSQPATALLDLASSSPALSREEFPLPGLAPVDLTPTAREYIDFLLRGDRLQARQVIKAAADSGMPVQEIYLTVLQPAQREIGRLWYQQEISVAEEHYCTAATQFIMSELYPLIFNTPKSGKRLVAACAEGELHEIGIRMVADFFELDGWDTYYLGANLPVEELVQVISAKRPHVLAVSATLAVRRSAVARLISRIKQSPHGGRLKIIVGGGAFALQPELWQELGAHGTAGDAQDALALAERLLAAQA